MPERSVAEAVPRRRRSRAASLAGPARRQADARVLPGAQNSPPAVLALQRRVGNRAVLCALGAETAGPVPAPAAPVRARSLPELLADPKIGKRLEAMARRGADVRAQIVEEVASEQMRVEVGQSGTHAGRPVEFIEGYRIRDINGRPLTDGLVLAGTGTTREALKVLEVKSSTGGAEALYSREERRESKERYRRADVHAPPGPPRSARPARAGGLNELPCAGTSRRAELGFGTAAVAAGRGRVRRSLPQTRQRGPGGRCRHGLAAGS